MTKNILGLDLGVSSIGWAVIAESSQKNEILGMGSRIIPLTTDDKDEFTKGNAISKNQKRTLARTARKGYDRYQLRRKNLTAFLRKHDMLPNEELIKLNAIKLWELRAKAAGLLGDNNDQLSLMELGRVIYHLNQKRGYKSARREENADKKDTEYVAEVKSRYQSLKDSGLTIGQRFYNELKLNEATRVKGEVFPREAYIEEFDRIIKCQRQFYPNLFTDEFIRELRNEIVYYQRALKSQKGLVNVCEFEGKWSTDKYNRKVFVGPKVAPRSSPIFQLGKIWEAVNTLSIKNKNGDEYYFTLDDKHKIIEHLSKNAKMSWSDLFKLLALDKKEGWYGNKQIEKAGIQGNLTYTIIANIVGDTLPQLLQFNCSVIDAKGEGYIIDKSTGELLETRPREVVDARIEKENLYLLWHIIYSIDDETECVNALLKHFGSQGLSSDKAKELAKIDFKKSGFGNKSAKAIRKILPYLMAGYQYDKAAAFAGYNHSNSLTKDENLKRELLKQMPNLQKNSLRQPVVEKILNQMINVVNAIIIKYGRPDEIRVELARELKQSKDERNSAYKDLNKRTKENEIISKRLVEEYGLRSTRNNIIKYRLFQSMEKEESKVHPVCVYCGKMFGIKDALSGNDVDVEHIIPKSLLFDDSQSNKILAHGKCNKDKGNRTAFDFMTGKGDQELEQYLERVEFMYKNGTVNKTKRDKLLMTASKIPKDFIDRQLRETQYIAKKAKELLNQVCHEVWSTSGTVTAHLRHLWGWDDVLMNLQLPKYRELGLTEFKEQVTGDGRIIQVEYIPSWSKRDDHRHHAIDALVIACTKQGYIQRINSLNAKTNRDEMYQELTEAKATRFEEGNLLDKYLKLKKPFEVAEVQDKASAILISFKAGKRLAVKGKRLVRKQGRKVVVQTNIVVPRGALSEQSVYGKINVLDKKKPVKFLFNNPELILKPYIRNLVLARLKEHDFDAGNALKSLKKNPIYLDLEKKITLEYATCFKEEFVLKYPLEGLKLKDVEYIIDEKVKQLVTERLNEHGGNEKKAFATPLYFNESKNNQIKSVRLVAGLNAVEAVKWDENKQPIGYVKPGNNHHLAIYKDKDGKLHEHACTLWHAVERKRNQLPIIINNSSLIWNQILQNEDLFEESFKEKLPPDGWELVLSLQQNEMMVMGLSDEEFSRALEENNSKTISSHLYRVQKMSLIGETGFNVWMRFHLETQIIDTNEAKISIRFINTQSINSLLKYNPKKIYISSLGEIAISNNDITSNVLSEPSSNYNASIQFASLDEMEAKDRQNSTLRSKDERMAFLQKLREITHDPEDIKALEKKIQEEGKIHFNN